MRNIEWPIELVRIAMQETRMKLENKERTLKQLREFESYISYLRTALSDINETTISGDICEAIEKVKAIVDKD